MKLKNLPYLNKNLGKGGNKKNEKNSYKLQFKKNTPRAKEWWE